MFSEVVKKKFEFSSFVEIFYTISTRVSFFLHQSSVLVCVKMRVPVYFGFGSIPIGKHGQLHLYFRVPTHP